jgi:regulator of protease activity HflC (stomatin/prohibitin superfamily)
MPLAGFGMRMPDQKGTAVAGFIFGIILLLGAVGAYISMSRRDKRVEKSIRQVEAKPDPKPRRMDFSDLPERRSGKLPWWAKAIPVIPAIAGVLLVFFSMFTIIPTKDVGVVTAFGAPVNAMHNGPNWRAPWQDVTTLDGAIQTNEYKKDANEGCITIRIAHQIVACANGYDRWQIKESGIESLFQNYRTFDNIKDSLIQKKLLTILNKVFENYDPLSVDPTTGQSNAPELSVLSAQAQSQMAAAVGSEVDILDVQVTVLNYDDATQKKINDLQGQVAQTRIAEQAVKTAEQQASANKQLADSVSKDPNVLVSKCFDHVSDAIARNYSLPAGFSCWPGGSGAVVVPSGTAATK